MTKKIDIAKLLKLNIKPWANAVTSPNWVGTVFAVVKRERLLYPDAYTTEHAIRAVNRKIDTVIIYDDDDQIKKLFSKSWKDCQEWEVTDYATDLQADGKVRARLLLTKSDFKMGAFINDRILNALRIAPGETLYTKNLDNAATFFDANKAKNVTLCIAPLNSCRPNIRDALNKAILGLEKEKKKVGKSKPKARKPRVNPIQVPIQEEELFPGGPSVRMVDLSKIAGR